MHRVVKPVDTKNKPVIVNIQQINAGIEQHILYIHEEFKTFLSKKLLSTIAKDTSKAIAKASKAAVEKSKDFFNSVFSTQQEPIKKEERKEIEIKAKTLTEEEFSKLYNTLTQPIFNDFSKADDKILDQALDDLLRQNPNKDLENIIKGVFDLYKKLISQCKKLNTFDTQDEKQESLHKQVSEFHKLTKQVEIYVPTTRSQPAPLERKNTLMRRFDAFTTELHKDERNLSAGSEEIQIKELTQPECALIQNIKATAQLQTDLSAAVEGFTVDQDNLKQAYKQKFHADIEAKKKHFHEKAIEHKQAILGVQTYLQEETKRQQKQETKLQQIKQQIAIANDFKQIETELTDLELVINREFKHPDSAESVRQLTGFITSVEQWSPSTDEDPLHGQDASIVVIEQEIKNNLQNLTKTLLDINIFITSFPRLKDSYGELVLRFFDFANDGPKQLREIINPLLTAISGLVLMTETPEIVGLKNAIGESFQYIYRSLFLPLKDDAKQKDILTKYLMHAELVKMNQQIPALLEQHKIENCNTMKVELEMKQTQIMMEKFKGTYKSISKHIKQQALVDITADLDQSRILVLAELTSAQQFALQYDHLLQNSQTTHTQLQEKALELRRQIAAGKDELALTPSTELSQTAPLLAVTVETPVIRTAPTTVQTNPLRDPTFWTIFAVVFLLAFFAGGAYSFLASDTAAGTLLLSIGILGSAGCCYRSIITADQASSATPAPVQDVLIVREEPDVLTPYRQLLHADQPRAQKGKKKEPIELTPVISVESRSSGNWSPRAIGRPSRLERPVETKSYQKTAPRHC